VQLPETPATFETLLMRLPPERALRALRTELGPEVGGKYLHWDEVRHRPAPEGLTADEWWLAITSARRFLRTLLPLRGEDGQQFHFARTDGLQRLLHRVDRQLGTPLQVTEPQLANKDLRDRYVVRSLMEEAITSSQLEGAATTRKVAKELLRSGRPPRTKDERMIANNFRAMELVRSRLEEPLSPELLCELHRVLTDGTMEPDEVGRFRRGDESVFVQDEADGQVLHMPPAASQLPSRIGALCQFANDPGDEPFIHPVVRAITLHFMLGYEHPFVDGNGRTARAIFYWSLLRQRYWLTEFLSISRILRKAKSQYARAFLHSETDRGDLTYFVLHQLDVIQKAAGDLHEYLERKGGELRESEKLLSAEVALNHRQRALLAHGLRHPGARYTIAAHRRESGVVYQTARQDLLELAAAGLLTQRRIGRGFVFDVPVDLETRLARATRP
jgi:Fic family protein